MQCTAELRRLLQRDPASPLDEDAAAHLWGALLDDALDDVQVGALVAALAVAGETCDEIVGLRRAAQERVARWMPSPSSRAVAIPVYGVVPGEALIAPLAAMLLRKFGVPVIVHGILDSPSGVSSAYVLRELGVLPCASLAQADVELAARGIAFLPVQLLSRAFAALLALRGRLGIENTAHLVAQALDPAYGAATGLGFSVEGTSSAHLDRLLDRCAADCVLLRWSAGRSPMNLSMRPRIERVHEGVRDTLFEADVQETRSLLPSPPHDAHGMARWIERVTTGAIPVPVPALSLVAACLYAVGEAPDLAQAKAIAAIHAGRLAA
jgi:anthranilate phosphoribosyltransferase